MCGWIEREDPEVSLKCAKKKKKKLKILKKSQALGKGAEAKEYLVFIFRALRGT